MPETSWDTIQRLCGEVGLEAVWGTVWVRHPDLVCEPMVDDPWSDSGARVCAVHQDEWWPCRATVEGRGVTPRPATLEQRLTVRPKSPDG